MIQNDATFNEQQFYIVDAKTGENRGSVVIDPYDAECETAAEEAHDNLVRSLIEAGGEMRELKELLHEAKDALLYMLVLHDSTHGHNMQEVVPILYHLQSDNRWNVQKAKEALKKISEYCEQEENNGT